MKTYPPEDRLRILAEWRDSGISAAEFSQQCGVSAPSLYNWRRQQEEGQTKGAFRSVVVRTEGDPATRPYSSRGDLGLPIVELSVAGVSARFYSNVSPQLLLSVVAALQGGVVQ